MSEHIISFRELIELVEASVQSGTIKNDYSDYLDTCRDLGISSYTLNLIIQRAKDYQKGNQQDEYTDHLFIDEQMVEEKLQLKEFEEKVKALTEENRNLNKQLSDANGENPPKVETIVKEVKKNSPVAWILAAIFMLCCFVELLLIANYIDKTRNLREQIWEIQTNNDRINEEKNEKLNQIYNMTNNISEEALLSFDDWTSTNHENGSTSSKSYSFHAYDGDLLLFNYYVSSESTYDKLIIKLTGDGIPDVLLVEASGEKSSAFNYTIDESGNYTLIVKYSKDGSYSERYDEARVTNVCLHKSNMSLLDSIRVISSDY